MTSPQIDDYPDGTLEYLSAVVTSDVALGGQDVELSLGDAESWVTGLWTGVDQTKVTAAGTVHYRTARSSAPVLFTDPADLDRATLPVYVRVTDASETPILKAGYVGITG